MNVIQFGGSLDFYQDFDQLDSQQLVALCTSSVDAIDDAYAVYSNYNVGAALLFEDGKIIKGSNQENAVYPLGLCAERVALFAAVSQYPGKPITALAVATTKDLNHGEYPPFPCGSCRQVILEMEQRQKSDITLYVIGSNKSVGVIKSVKDILPFAFDKDSL